MIGSVEAIFPIEDHFETLEQVYDERFSKQYGFFRSYAGQLFNS
jgi:hypothetical protein